VLRAMPSRRGSVNYLIDAGGVVKYTFDSIFNFKGHVEEALKTLQEMKAG
jgi:thioredoxin-dependent peroxiredoxin